MESVVGGIAAIIVALIGGYVALKKGAQPGEQPAPVQGQTIDTSLESLVEEIRYQLKTEQRGHRACHAAMRRNGVDIPHD